jgi:large subunit ribosomal protein L9
VEIILLEKIENMGGIGDRVNVKSGYARNYLIPQGKATLATAANIAKFEEIRAELEKKAAEEVSTAEQRAEQLRAIKIEISQQAGPGGKLFGSVGTVDIAEACAEQGVQIERSEIRLPDGPLRVAGEHFVDFHLHADVNVRMAVFVDGGDYEELPEESQAAESESAEDVPGGDADTREAETEIE